MMKRIKIKIVSVFFVVSVFIFLLTGGIVIKFSNRIINDNLEIAHVSKLYEIVEDVRITLRSSIISQRNYLITGENRHYLDYLEQKTHLLNEMEKLIQIESTGYINEKEKILLYNLIKNKLQILDEMTDLLKLHQIEDIDTFIEEKSNPVYEKIQANASNIEKSLEKVTAEFRVSSQRNAIITKISVYSGYSVAFMLLFISFFNLQRQIKRRKFAENELKNKTQVLSGINAEKDKFFSILAHDLKNPFTALLGLMDLLKESIDKKDIDQIKEITNLVDASSRKTYDLLHNLLEWARIQTGRLTPDFVIINVYEIIKGTYELFAEIANNKNITVDLPNETKVPAFADKNMIQTVFRNILSNAIKFTPENGHIKIGLHTDKAQIIVSITDSGNGIKQEEVPLLFRLDTDTSLIGEGGNKGTGLGLILAKELVQKNKGDIWVESEYGNGSTFFISIPRLTTS